jgi:hypothetical protein
MPDTAKYLAMLAKMTAVFKPVMFPYTITFSFSNRQVCKALNA